MTVVARKVTATTSDRVYTEDTDLHSGAYGIEHDAVIVFTDVNNFIIAVRAVAVSDVESRIAVS